jgi:FMN-dependent NADH-azoreductase
MPTLLHLDSSSDLVDSRSRVLTQVFAESWMSAGADHRVIYRDLHTEPLPHLPDSWLHWPAKMRPPGWTLPAGSELLQAGIIAELLAADVVLIGAPMYNYSLPSTLKAWVDYIHVPGVTLDFEGSGRPMEGKSAVVVNTRGAIYDAGTPTETWDHGTPVLDLVLGVGLGMSVSVVTVSRTMADFVLALADQRESGAEELESARVRLIELAGQLSVRS